MNTLPNATKYANQFYLYSPDINGGRFKMMRFFVKDECVEVTYLAKRGEVRVSLGDHDNPVFIFPAKAVRYLSKESARRVWDHLVQIDWTITELVD